MSDIEQIKKLNQYAIENFRTHPTHALEHALTAYQLSNTSPETKDSIFGRALSLANLSVCHGELQSYQVALDFAINALRLLEKNPHPDLHPNVLYASARSHSFIGNLEISLSQGFELLTAAQEVNSIRFQILAKSIIASVASQMPAKEDFLQHAIDAFRLAEAQEDINLKLDTYALLAGSHLHHEKYQQALDIVTQGLVLCEESPNSYSCAHLLGISAMIHLGLGEPHKALQLNQQSHINYLFINPRHRAIIFTFLRQGKILKALNRFKDAIDILEQAIEITQKNNSEVNIIEVHRTVSDIYEEMGEFKNALIAYKKFTNAQEKYFAERKRHQLSFLEFSHQTEMVRREAEILRVQSERLQKLVNKKTSNLEASLKREQLLAQELRGALDTVNQLSILQSRIITTVSHEFRTPLAVINTSLHLIMALREKGSPEQFERIHNRINESIFYLIDLLNDAVAVDNVGRDAVKPVNVIYQLNSLMIQLIEFINETFSFPQTIQFENNIHAGDLTEINTDKELLFQIISNLISNALKYSISEPAISFSCHIKRNHLILQVKDKGIGILPADLKHINKLFYRGSNINERRGMGLGLFIVDKYANLLDARLMIESEGEHRGATFTILLPVSK